MRRPALIAGCLGILLAPMVGAQVPESSFSDSVLEFQEAKLTLQTAASEIADLRKRLQNSEETVRRLTESLAVANAEAEYFRNQSFELKLRIEALGLESVGGDEEGLQSRLLKAARDLQILQEEKDELATQMIELSESILRYIATAETTDFEARLDVEAQLRESAELLGYLPTEAERANPIPSSLLSAGVLSIKEEWGLVVLNVGKQHGVKSGMTFKITRNGRPVARVRVGWVRESISGAVIQELDLGKERIRVGDPAKAELSR